MAHNCGAPRVEIQTRFRSEVSRSEPWPARQEMGVTIRGNLRFDTSACPRGWDYGRLYGRDARRAQCWSRLQLCLERLRKLLEKSRLLAA